MSTTTMYVFRAPRWEAVVHNEWSDSWGWAAFIWEALLERYWNKIEGVERRGRFFRTEDWPKLWEQEARIPFESWERNVLRATYDRAVIVGLTDIARIAGELRRFQKEHWLRRMGLCHLTSIAESIEKLLFDMGHTWVPTAIGFQATSCAKELWTMPTGERDESRPYSLLLDDLHHEVKLVPSIWDRTKGDR